MAPQDDLTAEHRKRLEKAIGDMLETEECLDIFDRAVRQTRQEALREARDYALACVAERDKQAFELTKTVLNDPRAVWLGCKASEAERIAEWLDRLASEGA